MPATLTDLTLDATVASELGVAAAGTVIPRIILAASDACRTFMNRSPCTYATAISEKTAGYGRNRLVLQRLPLVSITSITIDGTAVTASEYEIEDAEAGLVYREAGFPWTGIRRAGLSQDPMPGTEARDITVVYVGGWVTPAQNAADGALARTLPFDIEEACIQTCVSMYRRRGVDGSISSETLGAASVSYRGANTAIGSGLGGILPDNAVALLRPYRLIR